MEKLKIKVLKNIYHKVRSFFWKIIFKISPLAFVKIRYRILVRKKLDLSRPRTFNEKLIWLMLYWKHPVKKECADKYKMRFYVIEKGLGHMLPELYGVYKNANEIEFEKLPNKFVLKCTHGCGFNVICKDKKNIDLNSVKSKMNKWIKINFSEIYGEIHYSQIEPRIIAEKYLGDFKGNLPIDYKIYCFNGKADFTMVCIGRRLDGYGSKYIYFDREWKRIFGFSKTDILANNGFSKPKCYKDMLCAAEKLSIGIPFVRIDFYCIEDQAIIGEMTFTPDGCIDMGMSNFGQEIIGGKIDLPDKITL